MTRLEIVNTEWALQLWKFSTLEYFQEIVDRMFTKEPVFIAWNGNRAEIMLGDYTIHSTATMVEALEWCQQFELPVLTQQRDIVPKLLEWLDEQGNDKTLSTPERVAYFNVQITINRLMREAK